MKCPEVVKIRILHNIRKKHKKISKTDSSLGFQRQKRQFSYSKIRKQKSARKKYQKNYFCFNLLMNPDLYHPDGAYRPVRSRRARSIGGRWYCGEHPPRQPTTNDSETHTYAALVVRMLVHFPCLSLTQCSVCAIYRLRV